MGCKEGSEGDRSECVLTAMQTKHMAMLMLELVGLRLVWSWEGDVPARRAAGQGWYARGEERGRLKWRSVPNHTGGNLQPSRSSGTSPEVLLPSSILADIGCSSRSRAMAGLFMWVGQDLSGVVLSSAPYVSLPPGPPGTGPLTSERSEIRNLWTTGHGKLRLWCLFVEDPQVDPELGVDVFLVPPASNTSLDRLQLPNIPFGSFGTKRNSACFGISEHVYSAHAYAGSTVELHVGKRVVALEFEQTALYKSRLGAQCSRQSTRWTPFFLSTADPCSL